MNAIRGEAKVTLADGRVLHLVRDFNALAVAEEACGSNMQAIGASIAKGGPVMRFTRALFFGALQRHHSEISLDEAGDLLISDGAAIGAAMERVAEASAVQDAGGGRKGSARPRTAKTQKTGAPKAGIGTRSSLRGAKKG
ncbi:hypothetical protein SAMN06295910_1892 [Allosphingosinicella indica]|uniref:Gene transfer agent family protein n=2 Tax=Allosphingosinicella indica TaxID=941907 RepID=A0A1X7GJ98_9SPHN|nr:hypothetical protein SAMN06295910_1892 [Allosphingosinicella indica]